MSALQTLGVTGNAQLLLGYVGGLIDADRAERDGFYSVVEVDAATGVSIIKHRRTGNTYRVSISQIGGTE